MPALGHVRGTPSMTAFRNAQSILLSDGVKHAVYVCF